jgi:BioD-like phosphotransacetylase family protein
VVGAMGATRARDLFKAGVLLIVPADREEIIHAAADWLKSSKEPLAGIVLSDDIKPSDSVLKQLRTFPCPVLRATQDSYKAASEVHDLIVKTRPDDVQKISLIQEIVAKHVNLDRILDAL